MASNPNTLLLPTLLLLLLLLVATTRAADEPRPSECDTSSRGECYNKPEALRLKLIAIATILISSVIGVCLPLATRSVPALGPDRSLFALVKAFASGVILATGYMHVLPDSFNNLSSPCLPKNPWSKFPFTAFVAMLSAVFTLMVDSLMLTFYKRKSSTTIAGGSAVGPTDCESPAVAVGHGHVHVHGHGAAHDVVEDDKDGRETTLRRNRIIVQVSLLGYILNFYFNKI